jgi:hypothetical protein
MICAVVQYGPEKKNTYLHAPSSVVLKEIQRIDVKVTAQGQLVTVLIARNYLVVVDEIEIRWPSS